MFRFKRRTPETAPSLPNRREKLLSGLLSLSMKGTEIAPLSRATVTKSEADIVYADRLSYEELCEAHAGAAYVSQSDIVPVDVVLGDRTLVELVATGLTMLSARMSLSTSLI